MHSDILKTLEYEDRLATSEEQETLSRFVGWGGIPAAFDDKNEAWAAEYAELKATLTPEEYREARASTLNAFYTSPTVIKAMYEALGNMGLQQGTPYYPITQVVFRQISLAMGVMPGICIYLMSVCAGAFLCYTVLNRTKPSAAQ